MKTTIKNRVALLMGTALLILCGGRPAQAQTIDIGPNQYAFQFTDNNNFGLFFNSTDSRYEFRNGSAAPIFAFSALNGQMSTNLQFGSSSDYLVAPNKYAFRSSVAPGVGLYSTNNRIQFLNAAALPVFSINVADGRFDTDIAFFAGKSLRVAPGEFGMRSAALPNAGLAFGTGGYEFRNAAGGTAVYIDATTGDMGVGLINPNGKLHVNGDVRVEGIAFMKNELFMEGWDFFSDQNKFVINENNVGPVFTLRPGGNAGLGTDDPTARLDVNGEARVRALPLDNALEEVVVVDADGNLRKRDAGTLGSGGSSLWSQNGTVAHYNNGRVGIGTNDPSASLGIESSSAGNLLHLNNTAGGTAYQDFFSGTTGHLTVGLVGGGNGEQVGQAIVWNRKNARLQFGTNNQVRMTIRNNGNVGIGTDTPTAKLHAIGSDDVLSVVSASSASGASAFLVRTGNGSIEGMIVRGNGRVGMGTTNPGAKLHVIGNAYIDGKVWGREVEVTLASFPDYVFKAGYDLMSLGELDAFIQANGHLPNMPTEAEVVENGLNLGDINVKLVEKVEELTLHLIEKDKEVKAMEERLKALEQMMNPSSDK